MPKICYEPKKFGSDNLKIVELSESICMEYAAKGYDLTLRQLYYQLVTRNTFPNTEQSYKRLGSIVSDARRAGLIDWDHIVDRTRNLRQASGWESPSAIVDACAREYRRHRWEGQPMQVEAWIEKDALAGVLQVAADEYSLPYFSCRGYCSDSEMWSAARRIVLRARRARQSTRILHLGDHDPSGLDMTRDICDRLHIFTQADVVHEEDGVRRYWLSDTTYFEIRRIALTREQIEEYNPPPNPAKTTDARFKTYEQEHGDESWELDALDPETITELVKLHVEASIVESIWEQTLERERNERNRIAEVAKRMRDEIGR